MTEKMTVKMEHFYILIMAGGGGTRLWPLSRRDRPKQMLHLTEDRSLFQVTVERLHDLITPERVYVVTGTEMAGPLHESTPYLANANFILEPFGRDSGPAAGLGLFKIYRDDPEAIVAILSADHHIADEERFVSALRCAADYASKGHIVTLGIDPSYPATGFGYIQRGNAIGEQDGFIVYEAQRFTEKPDEPTATAFIASGQYSWNAGIFIMQAKQAIAEFARQRPAMHELLSRIDADPSQLETLWGQIEKLSIDFAIMEGAQRMAVIPVDIGWSDVGTWATLFDVLARDEDDNAQRGQFKDHIRIDTKGTLIVSDRMVVTIGVNDLVIVDTNDVILICHRDRAQDVRLVVKKLQEQGQTKHL